MTYAPHPLRIQRKRTKGFRLPPASCSVTRPGKWGNPFATADEFESVFSVIQLSGLKPEDCFSQRWNAVATIVRDIKQLRGFKLACFCPLDQPCHADVLAREANRD